MGTIDKAGARGDAQGVGPEPYTPASWPTVRWDLIRRPQPRCPARRLGHTPVRIRCEGPHGRRPRDHPGPGL